MMIYVTSNGTPVTVADTREQAAKLFTDHYSDLDEPLVVLPSDINAVDELLPRDRHLELIEAIKNRRLWAVAC